MTTQTISATVEAAPVRQQEKRRNPRAKISKPMRARPVSPNCAEEVQPTLNASRDGLYFTTSAAHYHAGMHVRITFPYVPCVDFYNLEQLAEVVRVDHLEDARHGIAVRFLLR
jgi:hypothetical protein